MFSYNFGKVNNMKDDFRLLFKILINFLIPREGINDKISWDHTHFILYLKNESKINLSAYIFNHLSEVIKDSTKLRKNNVPYARLLSELFFQGRLIDAFKSLPGNEELQAIYGNILSASILANMKMKKKCEIVASKIPLSIRCTNYDYLGDDHVVTMMDNPEVIKISSYSPSKKEITSDSKIFLTNLLMFILLRRGSKKLQLFWRMFRNLLR